jgi:hypothetical protein
MSFRPDRQSHHSTGIAPPEGAAANPPEKEPFMNRSSSLSPAGDARNQSRNPGRTATNGSQTGTIFANITGSTHGPRTPKKIAKAKEATGDIVGKATKAAAPGKKSSPKAKGAGKVK